MSAEPQSSENQGETLLSAVERVVDSPESVVELVEDFKVRTPRSSLPSEGAWRREVAAKIVSNFSRKSALSGGVTSLPALIPGIGTLAAALGGTFLDLVLVLKFEVEMAMALTYLHGFDIRERNERQFAFLLASVQTYEAKTGRNFLVDLGSATGTAMWNYTPRQLSKSLLKVMSALALRSVSRGLLRAVPVVGAIVNTSVNKVFTTKVGHSCIAQLNMRRKQAGLAD